jgi:hypothetical protein
MRVSLNFSPFRNCKKQLHPTFRGIDDILEFLGFHGVPVTRN